MKTIYTDNSKLLEILVANGINIICNSQMEMVVSDTDAIKIDAIVAIVAPSGTVAPGGTVADTQILQWAVRR